ncbi:hypothetical protein LY76DRAFT_249812 [Colletotrichum caudatum]|nr:hypothetical protein LY76DRAFT_249812 [Colletotrichum caudatum]
MKQETLKAGTPCGRAKSPLPSSSPLLSSPLLSSPLLSHLYHTPTHLVSALTPSWAAAPCPGLAVAVDGGRRDSGPRTLRRWRVGSHAGSRWLGIINGMSRGNDRLGCRSLRALLCFALLCFALLCFALLCRACFRSSSVPNVGDLPVANLLLHDSDGGQLNLPAAIVFSTGRVTRY